jgi:DNA primase
MPFPPQFLDEIRTRVTLSSLVGRKLRLTRAGREWRAPCPFHKEKTPSFYVNDQKGFFHCFGCGAHGDVVGFLMRHDNLAFPEAVEALAAEAGLEVPKPTEAERHRYEKQKTLHEVLEAATLFFEEELRKPAGRRALAYLQARGLDDETIASFRLGYAPADAQALRAALTAKNCQEADLIELGLLKRADNEDRTYSFFRDRVIFPVGDRRGRPVAFGARLIDGDGPKYINSPEHPLFHKGETVYGLARARQAAADSKPLIIAEGYMDVIALNRAGYTGAVAPMGTAVTEAQIETLWRLTPQGVRAPILCLDGDTAGQRAAIRAMERILPLLRPDHTLKFAFLPKGEDPDSLIRQGGAKAIATIVDSAIPFADMLWRATLAERPGQTPEELAGFRAHLLGQIGRIADASVRFNYQRAMEQRLRELSTPQRRFEPRLWKKSWPLYKGGKPLPPRRLPQSLPAAGDSRRSKILLAAMLNHPFLFEEFCEGFSGLVLPEPLQPFHAALCQCLQEESSLTANNLHNRLVEKGFAGTLSTLSDSKMALDTAFARPGASPDQVREGWQEIMASGERRILHAEMLEAAANLGKNMDESAFSRLRALQEQLNSEPSIDKARD